MSLRQMKDEMHDLLWNAQQSWFQLRAAGWTKHGLKMAGIRSTGDANTLTRGIIFTGRTRGTYEGHLKSFLVYVHEHTGVRHLSDITISEARDYLEHCIAEGWAAKTLKTLSCALAKFGALTGKTESLAALSRKCAQRIRQLTHAGVIAGPSRATPSPEKVERAIGILADWDAQHLARTGQPRAYALAARLQLETAARSVSATERVTLASLKEGDRVELIGKGGKILSFRISPELHDALHRHLSRVDGPLADRNGYRMALCRAIEAAGGRVTGTHGLRRLSTQFFYSAEYRRLLSAGNSPRSARRGARQAAVERLGHSRSRSDQVVCYLT